MSIFATLPPADAKVEAVFRYMDTLPYSERQAYLANNLDCKVQRLYKYRPLDPASADSISRVHDIIVAGRLWLSSPLDFNDPFDLTAQSVFEGTREEKKARLQILIDEKAANLSPRKRREMVAKILARPIDAMTANVHDASNAARIAVAIAPADVGLGAPPINSGSPQKPPSGVHAAAFSRRIRKMTRISSVRFTSMTCPCRSAITRINSPSVLQTTANLLWSKPAGSLQLALWLAGVPVDWMRATVFGFST